MSNYPILNIDGNIEKVKGQGKIKWKNYGRISIFVLTLKRGILRQVLEDITLVINGLSEYADYKELLDGDKNGMGEVKP